MIDRAEYLRLVTQRPELFRNPPGAGYAILLDEDEIRQAEQQTARRLGKIGAPASWARVGVAFRDEYLLLLRDAVRYADGTAGTYIRMIDPKPRHPGVAILPIWRKNVLLIRHFRHATRRWHLEIPRGFGTDTDPRASARRELLEEIGAAADALVDLGEVYPDTGSSDSRVTLFHAEVTSYGSPEQVEGITEILPTPIAEFEQMIGNCVIQDSFSLASYARARTKNLI